MAEDAREPLPMTGGERELLTGYLDWYRETLRLKCEGLTAAQLSERSVRPSGMSLHGLLRHLAGVERWWFRIQFGGQDLPLLFFSDEDPDQDFDWERSDPHADPAGALETWQRECARSRELVAATADLEATGTHLATGQPVSLRRVLLHLTAEYARHCGHADLLRERIDGATGH
nr:DinB family protein [Streptomyces boncukensis]